MPRLIMIGGLFIAIAALALGYLVAALYLSAQEGVVLKTDKEMYERGEVVRVKLVNLRSSPIWVGSVYRVEYYNGTGWIVSDELTPDFFTSELRGLYPGRSMEWSIPLDEAIPGKYRIVKEVWLDDSGKERLEVYAYFEVKG